MVPQVCYRILLLNLEYKDFRLVSSEAIKEQLVKSVAVEWKIISNNQFTSCLTKYGNYYNVHGRKFILVLGDSWLVKTMSLFFVVTLLE